MQLGERKEAIQHLRRNLELDPSADGVHSVLGFALYQEEEYEEAQEVLETALRLNSDSHEARYHLGLVLEKLNQSPEAVIQYRRCLALAPDFAPARARLTELLNP